MSAIGNEVDFADMLALTEIEVFCPSVYTWIKDNKKTLTGYNDFHFGEKLSQIELLERYKEELRTILESEGNPNSVDIVFNLLCCLFPYFGNKVGYHTMMKYEREESYRRSYISTPDKFDRYFDLDPNNVNIKREELNEYLYKAGEESLYLYLLRQDKLGNSFDLMSEIKSVLDVLPEERLFALANSIIRAIHQYRAIYKGSNILSLPVYALTITFRIIEKMSKSSRVLYVSKMVEKTTSTTLPQIAYIISLFCSRLEEDEIDDSISEENYLISKENCDVIVERIVEKAFEILQENILFDIENWDSIYYLLTNHAADKTDKYLKSLFADHTNVVRFLICSCKVWKSNGNIEMYEITDEYKKYLIDDEIRNAIQSTVQNRTLDSLSYDERNVSRAFWVYLLTGKQKVYPEDINENPVCG